MNCTPVFESVYNFVTSLDKYKVPPEARILGTFNTSEDMNLATLFEGGYLYISQPEAPLLYAKDLREIVEKDSPEVAGTRPEAHLPIGRIGADAERLIAKLKSSASKAAKSASELPTITTGPLQTKSLAADLSTLSISGIGTPQTKQGSGPILIGTLLEAPVNLGGLSRAANVFGCHSLHVPNINVLQNAQFKNVSVDSELHIDVQESSSKDLLARLRGLKEQGWMIVGLEQTSDSRVIGTPDIGPSSETLTKKLPKRAVIVMGAESTGIPADILFECDTCVEIKQWGVTRSLNVQTAAACVLFEWRREWGDGTPS
jgi:tRNA guanosine-2'-O-methyltransferase